MRESSLMPTTLLDWPRVAPLLPEQKLILGLGLWGGRYTNSVGVATLPAKPLAATLGLDRAALLTGIRTLVQANLLLFDEDTYEVWVRDWFRFHKFRGPGVKIAKREIERISSPKIRVAVEQAANGKLCVESVTCLPNSSISNIVNASSSTRAGGAAASPLAVWPEKDKGLSAPRSDKRRRKRDSGIVCFYPDDGDAAEIIERSWPTDDVAWAVSHVKEKGLEAVPGRVERAIEELNRGRRRRQEESGAQDFREIVDRQGGVEKARALKRQLAQPSAPVS